MFDRKIKLDGPWISMDSTATVANYRLVPVLPAQNAGPPRLGRATVWWFQKKIGKEVQDDVVSINGGNPKLSIFNWEFPL